MRCLVLRPRPDRRHRRDGAAGRAVTRLTQDPGASGAAFLECAPMEDRGFVDEGRADLRDELVRAYERVRDAKTPRAQLISLEARSGYGKTRLVQELYAAIARDQDYWEPELVDPL